MREASTRVIAIISMAAVVKARGVSVASMRRIETNTACTHHGVCFKSARSKSQSTPNRRREASVIPRAMDMFVEDSVGGYTTFQMILLVFAGVAGAASGVAVPMFFNNASMGAAKRTNTQTCFNCSGNGTLDCRFCEGTGVTEMLLNTGKKEVSKCVNCSGIKVTHSSTSSSSHRMRSHLFHLVAGNRIMVCTTCGGSGIQPRYLDRR